MMRDGVTVMIGALCFLVAGSVFVLFGGGRNTAGKRDRGGPRSQTPDGSDKTTRENKSGYKRAAS